MTLDRDLVSWLDAARTGGLPAPVRDDRWQPLRAGVVNLWEFEAAEYWYARGWVQLTGRNESGKSSLMALTTLIPWLGDTSSPNIDTLGRSGKKFRYYVEPTGADGDRRTADASTNRGWLWVEYGRLRDGVPAFFTTLLFAETRASTSSVALTWCTAEGPRVRLGLDLAPHRVPAHPRELEACGVRPHPTATAYKQHVARHLLGTSVDRLEAAGKMLRVTRTPKLGAELQVGFVSEHLRTALPELDRAEVDALAAGWDQLDRLRADLEAAREGVDVLERFRARSWVPWVRAELRRRADRAARARTEFDQVTRSLRDAEASVAELTDTDERLRRAAERAVAAEDAARAAREELQGSTQYRDARERLDRLESLRRETTQWQGRLSSLTAAAADADRRRAEAEEEAAQHAAAADATRSRRDVAQDALAAAAAAAGAPLPSGEVDLPLVEQRLRERRAALDRARELLRAAGRSDAAAGRAEEAAADLTARARDDRARAEESWRGAEQRREGLVGAVAGWAATLDPPPDPALVDRWIAALPSGVTDGHVVGTPFGDLMRADWADPARRALDRRQADAGRHRAEAEAEAAELTARIEALTAAPVPVFGPPAAWARRERPAPSASGAPVWLLLDPRPGVPEADLARVEAALAAQGVLDAWVTPDGVFRAERDGADTVIERGPRADGPGPVLGELLQVSDAHPELAGSVEELLAAVRVVADDEALPVAGWAVATDGRWRAGGLAGRAHPREAHAEWIGESARAARRRRTLAELAHARELVRGRADAAAAAEQEAERGLAALVDRIAVAPSDAELRADLVRAAERDEAAERSAADAARAEARATDLRTAADRAAAALHAFCVQRTVPQDETGLTAAERAVHGAELAAREWAHAVAAVADAERALAAADDRLAGRRADVGRAERDRTEAARRLEAVRASAATLEAALGADDARIVAELERLTLAEASARADRERVAVERQAVGTRLGGARTTLANAEDRREQATGERDVAYADFRAVVDHGLAAEADLDLPDAHASTVERVREQVSHTRRVVVPARWPDEPEEQAREERRLYARLTEQVHEVRTRLEARGRSLQLVTDESVGLPRIEVQVDASGVPHGPREAAARLGRIRAELESKYTVRVQETLDELLGSTFLEHLRARVGATDALVKRINGVLARHPVVTTKTSLRIVLEPAGEQDRVMLDALRGPSLANPEAAGHVREHLRTRVEDAKREAARAGDADWRDRLVEALDHRRWVEVRLQRKIGAQGGWAPLTSQAFAEMSGGARAVMLMLPLVATLAALYEDMDGAPRPLWLDEAFDGLDSANRSTVMSLFQGFDLDVLLAGPNRLVTVSTVPAAAIYQVVRAPAPLPGADLTLELWAGGDLTVVDLPAMLPTGPDTASDASQEEALW